MPITQQDKKELNKIYNEYYQKFEGKKEDYFALLYLTKKFNKSIEELSEIVAFGNNDYGFDAFYIDREARNLYLFQFKWSENHLLFKESLQRIINDGLDRIFGNPLQDPKSNQLLNNLKNDLYENQNLIDRIFIQFVFKGDVEAADKSEGLTFLREELDNKKWIIDKYFREKKIDLIFEFISDKRISQRTPRIETHTMNFSDSISQSQNGKKMYIGFLSLYDLNKIYNSLGVRFLNRNIRAGLSENNPPNRKIKEALNEIIFKQIQEPDVFVFNHNGITLAAEKIEIIEGKIKLYVPRLLNGAQTITTVNKFCENNKDNSLFELSSLKDIKVLAKIIEDSVTSEFITMVTINNNRQNPVEPWHLRANDKIQCDFQDKFASELGIYYSRQENSFENLTDSDLEEQGIVEYKDLKIKLLARTFLAIQGEIDKMSRLTEVFDNQKIYSETFRESYLSSNSNKILIAYKTLLIINSPIRQLYQVAPNYMQNGINSARNLIATLLIQGLFNDSKFIQYVEWFGNSLRKESDFREYHSKLVRNKILPILKEVLKEPSYKDKIEKEKYSFFRTKEIFRRSMEIAGDFYGWSKKSI